VLYCRVLALSDLMLEPSADGVSSPIVKVSSEMMLAGEPGKEVWCGFMLCGKEIL